ncbi:MAG: formylglycine-generating enzyme family protein [Bdellovibrio sp.]
MTLMTFAFTYLFFLGFAFGNVSEKWILIPSGSYKPFFALSELNKKGTKKQVTMMVDRFELQKNSVTNQEFLEFVLKNPEWRKNKVKAIFADKSYLRHWQNPTIIENRKILKEPVVNVSWFAATAFCESIGARLPSTDEWEFIASQDDPRKRDEIILNWYSKSNDNTAKAKTAFVGIYGIENMYGKIWEWTSDFNSSLLTGESREDNSSSRTMFCGAGSIGASNPSEYATFMRFAFRSSLKGNYSLSSLGFRCARTMRSL